MRVPEPVIIFMNEGASPTWLARIEGSAAIPIVQADVTSIAFSIREREDTSVEVSNGTLVVADVIFDALQTDALWEKDITGYNFKFQIPAAKLSKPDSFKYLVEVTFTMQDNTLLTIIAHIDQLEVSST